MLVLDPGTTVAAGDWLANTRWAVAAVHHAADMSATGILHLGDFGFTFETGFVRALTDALETCDMHLWFIRGNHDSTD